MRIIRTKPFRKDKLRKQFADEGPLIADKTCRVCGGKRKYKRLIAQTMEYDADCRFCDESGNAKNACGDCGEVLPGCKCVRMMGHCLPPTVPSFQTEDGYTLYWIGGEWRDHLEEACVDLRFNGDEKGPIDINGERVIERAECGLEGKA